ncbi:MAG: hypothetical protein OXC02_00660 [Rhodobacteraceae bacterium]|nr:hypothetical protein [Paracoccaceae bacterium]
MPTLNLPHVYSSDKNRNHQKRFTSDHPSTGREPTTWSIGQANDLAADNDTFVPVRITQPSMFARQQHLKLS